jgi:hypothetical protein
MRKNLQLVLAMAALTGLMLSAAANTQIEGRRARLVASALR